MVPGLSRMRAATCGITGLCTACMRFESIMGCWVFDLWQKLNGDIAVFYNIYYQAISIK